MAKKKKKSGLAFVITLVVSIVVVSLSFLFLKAWGEKSGTEFSPDDFAFRRFDYCRLPILNWTYRGIKYTDIKNTVGDTLLADDWIRKTGRDPKRWHLVREKASGFGSSLHSLDCDAHFLTDYFDMYEDEGDNRIALWNDAQPKSAKIFWPLLAEMARGSLYLQIPEVMEFALEYPDADKSDLFEQELKEQISEAWYQGGLTDKTNGRHKRAIERFEKAMALGKNGHQAAATAKSESAAVSP